MFIEKIIGREIIDSRGNPTLEVELQLDNGVKQYASVPSGASIGMQEAVEMRDYDIERYHGMGLHKSIEVLNRLVMPALHGKKLQSVKELDQLVIELDGTHNKAKVGANTSLALSLAFAKCLAVSQNIPLYKLIANEYRAQSGIDIREFKPPIPMLNVINGGKHADNRLVLQEFMIVPIIDSTIQEQIRISCEFFSELKDTISALGYSTNVGDEGGFAPRLESAYDALDLLMQVLENDRYRGCFKFAIDAAASTFYDKKYSTYALYEDDDEPITNEEMINFYGQLISEYPILSIEDPIAEEDFIGWQMITKALGSDVMLVGDDLFVTNTKNLQYGIDNRLGNAILIKPNQIGTLTETISAVHLARSNGYEVVVSHRSGETEDTSLAHLAVGLNASYIKAGAPSRSERVAKYNELIRIFP
jgi:enolase